MAVHNNVWKILEEQKRLVLALDNPEVIETAKQIAFYIAMRNASVDDPMDDQDEQNEMLTYFADQLYPLVESYMELVNEEL